MTMSGRWSARRPHPMRRAQAVVSVSLLALVVAACGSGEEVPTLTWYINPDNGGQARLAEKCAPEGGAYKVEIQTLPNDASQQREQLVRRLAAQDSSIDLMSLDPPFVAEFANAGFLRVFDKADEAELTEGVLDAPLETVYWDEKLVAAPFWANTQLLWYRKAAVEAAGIDPSSPQIHLGRHDQGRRKGRQGHRRPGQPLRGLHGVDQCPGRLRGR